MKKIGKRVSRGKKGISIVIATVILVAVAITVAVSVAFWMGSIAGQYTRFEKIQVQDPLITKDSDGNWTLTFTLKNIGSSDATINDVLINGKSLSDWGGNITVTTPSDFTSNGLPLTSGASGNIVVYIKREASNISAGTTIEVKFRSVAGMEYPKMVTLP